MGYGRQIIFLLILTLLLVSCESGSVSPENDNTGIKPSAYSADISGGETANSSSLHVTLAQVRRKTSQFHNVATAEKAGYMQESPFIPGMGYHYINKKLMDSEVVPTRPEALVYNDHPVHDNKRRLVAVEYIIPEELVSRSDLDGKFPGVDSDHWHKEDEISAWTLHAWIWYPNPKGVFHPHNPRVGSGS